MCVCTKWLEKKTKQFLAVSGWKDLARLKFCMLAIGVLIGMMFSERHKKLAAPCAFLVFAATYYPLLFKFFKVFFDLDDDDGTDNRSRHETNNRSHAETANRLI